MVDAWMGLMVGCSNPLPVLQFPLRDFLVSIVTVGWTVGGTVVRPISLFEGSHHGHTGRSLTRGPLFAL